MRSSQRIGTMKKAYFSLRIWNKSRHKGGVGGLKNTDVKI